MARRSPTDVRVVRADRDRAARRAAAGRDRAAPRCRARARPPRAGPGRARDARLDHPLRERLRGTADARALPRRPAGRSARRLPHDARVPGRRVRDRAVAVAPGAGAKRFSSQDPALDLSPAAPSTATTDAERTLLVVALDERADRRPALGCRAARGAAGTRADRRAPAHGRARGRGCRGGGECPPRVARRLRPRPRRSHRASRRATSSDSRRTTTSSSCFWTGRASRRPSWVSAVQHSPADLAFLFGAAVEWTRDAGIFVAFGGAENDWAALELAAWLASAAQAPLKLVGTAGDPSRGRRDASRLLADASLAVQRVIGVAAEPLLAEAATRSVVRRPRAGDGRCHRISSALAGGKRRQTVRSAARRAAGVVRASRYSAERSCAEREPDPFLVGAGAMTEAAGDPTSCRVRRGRSPRRRAGRSGSPRGARNSPSSRPSGRRR